MEPSSLLSSADAIRFEEEMDALGACPCCGSKLAELGGLVRCLLCQFSFCRTCGDDLAG